MKRTLSIICILILVILSGCTPFFPFLSGQRDNTPPWIDSFIQQSEGEFLISFNEPVRILTENSIPKWTSSAPIGTPRITTADGSANGGVSSQILVTWPTNPADHIGAPFFIQGTVTDLAGNTLWFELPGFGYNPSPAQLRLNEIRIVHTVKRPEAIEIICVEEGNIGGLTLWIGTPTEFTYRLVLPDLFLDKGDFILVVFRIPEDQLSASTIDNFQLTYWGGLQIENQETLGITTENPNSTAKTEESAAEKTIPTEGPLSSLKGWPRLCLLLPGGLSDTTQGITLTTTPMPQGSQSFMDCLLYTKKATEPSASHNGFGTAAALGMAEEIINMNSWQAPDEMEITPGLFVDNTGSTATRTLNRRAEGLHLQDRSVWYIAASGADSLGLANSENEYSP